MPIGSKVYSGKNLVSRRTILGVFLILLAMALTFLAVRIAGHMDRYWVAKETIVAGQSITTEMLVAVEANPGVAAEHYFLADELPSLRATQTIAAGELLAKGAVTDVPANQKKLVVRLASPLPSGVSKGDYLEIWQLPGDSEGSFSSGELPAEAWNVAKHAVFIAEKKPGTTVRVTEDTSVEILVSDKDLAGILAAVGKKQPLVAIPVAS